MPRSSGPPEDAIATPGTAASVGAARKGYGAAASSGEGQRAASRTQNIQKRRRIDPLAASDDEGKERVQLSLAADDFEDDSEDAEEPTDADKQAEAFAAWTQDGAAK